MGNVTIPNISADIICADISLTWRIKSGSAILAFLSVIGLMV